MAEGSFGTLMAATDPAIIVVTTVAEGERAGCVVGFHGQASIAPQHYAVWLSKANHTYRVALRSTLLAVHFLSADDVALAEHFGSLSGDTVDKFAHIDLDAHDRGLPLLSACRNRIELERTALLDVGGDHVCMTARVLTSESDGAFTPLRVSAETHLDPGHGSEERAISPREESAERRA